MQPLLEIAQEKLESLDYPIYKGIPIMAQIIAAILNLTTEDELELETDLNRYSPDEVIVLGQELLACSETRVMTYLRLTDPDRQAEIAQRLEKAITKEEIRELLIEEILVTAIKETEDPDPQ